jgi:hypothetical protein
LRTKTGIACVSGRVWWMAGFIAGDAVRFTRYKNATVIEKATPEQQHSVLARTRTGVPRHYIGTSLFDFHKASRVRIVAVAGAVIVTLPDSDIGIQCEAQEPTPVNIPRQTPGPVYRPEVPASVLDASSLKVLAKKDYSKDGSSIAVTGRLWTVAGFEYLQPARVVNHANALVIEPCDEAQMDFRIGYPSRPVLLRVLSLAHTVLANETRIRVFICEGKLVLTGRNSDIGRKLRAAVDWPEPNKVEAFIEQLQRPPEEPAVELSTYQLPDGGRLQIQGKWLGQFGFTPGAKFEVESDKQGVSLRLVADGGATVTAHSPGASKLYVPAQSFSKLKAAKVRVLGRPGELRLLPQAA